MSDGRVGLVWRRRQADGFNFDAPLTDGMGQVTRRIKLRYQQRYRRTLLKHVFWSWPLSL